MRSSFKEKLRLGSPLLGTILTLPTPEISEILCSAGFDWLFVDLEHSAMDIQGAQAILQAATPEVDCLIRIPSCDETWSKKSLDIGASGIIIPQILSAEQAAQAVRWCRYPPEGSRSVGIARAQGYGDRFKDYVARANTDIVVILQIEHIQTVERIESILRISDIDGLFIGPYDLSASMGRMGQVTHPDVQHAIRTVKTCADDAEIPVGIFGAGVEAAKPYIEDGYSLIAIGIDTMILGNAARDIVTASSR